MRNNLTTHFEVKRGLKEGHGLAPLLFNIALECTIRQLSDKWNLLFIYITDQIPYYAEDIKVTGKTMQTVGDRCTEIKKHRKQKL